MVDIRSQSGHLNAFCRMKNIARNTLDQLQKLTLRQRWAIGAALICAAVGGGWWALRPAIEPHHVDRTQLYDQVLGNPRSSKPRRFTFYWSATNQKSVDAYQKAVVPLMNKEDPTVETLIVQILDNDVTDENGPGGLMLCPKHIEDYAKLVVGYLNNGQNVGTLKVLPESQGKKYLFVTNATLDEAQKRGLLYPAECMDDEYFWSRFVLALRENKKLFQRSPLKQLPQIEIDGVFMLPEDPRVAQFVRRAKSAPAGPTK
jgi:hypothetical protein